MSVQEKISGILKQLVESRKDVRLVVLTDDKGLVVGAYPYIKEKTELLENIGAVFAELLHQVFQTINVMAPKIADKITKISIGLKSRVIEFYPGTDLNMILLKLFASEED